MPGFTGTAALTLLRQHDADLPFIFVSGTIGEDAAVAAMRTGAHDYLMKGGLKRLIPAVERELRDAGVRRERRRVEQRLVHLAYHDALTDLPNRALLHDRLDQATRIATREGKSLALLLLDLNGFKEINDTLGHHAGDRVLQFVASRLRATLREADTVARLGGDEFAVLLPFADLDGALLTAQKLLHEIEQPCVIDHRSLSVRASLGIACFPEHGSSADTLLQKADVAMYVAKSDGVGISVYAPSRDQQTHRRLTLVSELRKGIDENQFFIEYQPILHLRTNLIIGVEALVRWKHPQHGRVLPGNFIHMAEQTGLINPLTTIVLETAIREWSQQPTHPPLTVSVNLSPRTLRDPMLPQRIAGMLAVFGAPHASLALEITENILMSDPARSMDCLKRLHDMGVRIVDRRLRHRLLVAQLPAPAARRRAEDRPFVRGGPHERPGRRDRAVDDRPRAQPRAHRRRRRRRERRRAGAAAGDGVRRRAGDLHQPAGAAPRSIRKRDAGARICRGPGTDGRAAPAAR